MASSLAKSVISAAAIGIGSSMLMGCASLAQTFLATAAAGAGFEAGKEIIQGDSSKQNFLDIPYFFECNSWSDIYNCGVIYYPRGYKGIKSDFKDNERLRLVGYNPSWKPGDQISFQILGPKRAPAGGDRVRSFMKGCVSTGGPSVIIRGWATTPDLMPYLMSDLNGGYGNYMVTWYKNGQEEDEGYFTISPSQE